MNQSKTCNQCSQTFSIDDFYIRKPNTNLRMAICKKCSNKNAREYQTRRAALKQPKPIVYFHCEVCGAYVIRIKPWQKFCSQKCFLSLRVKTKNLPVRLCKRCNNVLVNKRANAIYCSKTCTSMDHSFNHRSKTRQGLARRMEIIQRDKSICYMCNQYVVLAAIEIDHIIPVARGGSSDISNLSVSCQKCNRSKGAKIGIAQLIRLTELRDSK